MGDGADIAISDMMDNEEDILSFRLGHILHDSAYDKGIIDELGYEYSSSPKTFACKYCGTDKLIWEKTNLGWRLRDSNSIHDCKSYKFSETIES